MSKYQHIFDTSHLQDDLKKRSLRSGAITLTSQGLQFVIQLASTMILARILSPADYGINAMAVTVTGFANMFSNLGLSAATVQRAEITHEQVTTLFWINAGIGLVITVIVASLAPVVALFYRVPDMRNVMLVLSTMFFISGLAVQHSALLTRQMRFLSLATINISSFLGGIIVAIVAAKSGFGYWSLIFNSIANIIISTVGMWIACRWIPGLPIRNVGIGNMIRFGADLVGFNVVNYFSRNLDNVLIGRYRGSEAIGLYSKAYQLLMMPITNLRDPMTNVAMPALSRLQHEPEQFKTYYLKCVSLLAVVSMPLVIFMFTCSDQLITLLLGSKWLGASGIFKILSVVALLQPVSSTGGMVIVSVGRSRDYFIIGAINAIIVSCSFVVGLAWGPKGVASAYALSSYLMLLPNLRYSFMGTKIRTADFFIAVYKPLFSGIFMGVFNVLFLQYVYIESNILTILSLLIVSTVSYVFALNAISSDNDALKELFSYAKIILIKNK